MNFPVLPLLFTESHSPNSRVEDVRENGDSDSGSRAGHHLDHLPPPLEVLAQHDGRRLPDHRIPHREQEAVAEEERKNPPFIITVTKSDISLLRD